MNETALNLIHIMQVVDNYLPQNRARLRDAIQSCTLRRWTMRNGRLVLLLHVRSDCPGIEEIISHPNNLKVLDDTAIDLLLVRPRE